MLFPSHQTTPFISAYSFHYYKVLKIRWYLKYCVRGIFLKKETRLSTYNIGKENIEVTHYKLFRYLENRNETPSPHVYFPPQQCFESPVLIVCNFQSSPSVETARTFHLSAAIKLSHLINLICLSCLLFDKQKHNCSQPDCIIKYHFLLELKRCFRSCQFKKFKVPVWHNDKFWLSDACGNPHCSHIPMESS